MTTSGHAPASSLPSDNHRLSFGCRICMWLRDRFLADEGQGSDSFWKASSDWERDSSNEHELWAADSDQNRSLAVRAIELGKADPEAAFHAYLEAAEAGSIWAMEVVGWHYDTGSIVDADYALAQEYYYRALSAGSWTASLRYAKLLEKHGYHDYWPAVLEDGVRSGFVPAFFWLAWYRCKHTRTRQSYTDAKPLMEHAANQGHPGAQYVLAIWMMFGKFGLRQIPAGFRLLNASRERYRADYESERADAPAKALSA